MHLLMVSGDAYPIINHHCDHDAGVGPSSLPPHAHEDDDGMPSYADKCLLGDLRCIMNRKCALGFPADIVGLHDACALHGVPPKLLDDNKCCFGWLVSHLFRGDCLSILSDPCTGLYEDSACVEVTLGMETALIIISQILNSVLSRLN